MNHEQAQKVAHTLKRSSKYNRKVKVRGILISKGKAHVQVTSKVSNKETGEFKGRPFHYPVTTD